jgi:NAD(P)H-flavin reductase
MQLDLIMGCHNEDSVSLALLFNIIKEQMAIISAPTGNAWWRHENRPTMLIVGGTGYAYARGIIKHLELLKMSCKIQLVWGERESASFYELSWLDNVKRNLKWFDYQLWAETVLENRKINQGNLIDALRQTNETCLFDFRYYLAGSVQMVRTLHAYLRSIGIATEDIISDVIFIN